MKDIWVIPFEGINYLCWKNKNGPQNRPLSDEEERNYFYSENKERYLRGLVH